MVNGHPKSFEPFPLVSIVTPFFNTEKYLAECIESVLKQTYSNLEYILVNNCSTDDSNEIARRYSNQDQRIRIVNNDRHLSQVQNYNRALSLISPSSRYCKIVQADDWIFPNCVQEMVNVAEACPSIGVVGAYRLDDKKVNCDGLPYPTRWISGREICRLSLIGDLFVFGSATSLLFRSDIVRSREAFYGELSRHEDTEACYEILKNNDFGFVHQVLTFTRRENESITSRIRRCDPFYLLDKYISILKYGNIYLDRSEYADSLKQVKKKYYQFLAWKMQSKDRSHIIEYHRVGLKNIGQRLETGLIVKYFFMELAKISMDPLRILKKMV